MSRRNDFCVRVGGQRVDRDFRSFHTAEAFARALVAKHKASPRNVEIWRRLDDLFPERLAVIDQDAYDRIWTDLTPYPGVSLI